MTSPNRRARRGVIAPAALAATIAASLLLAGCLPDTDDVVEPDPAQSAQPSASPNAAIELVPDGDATANKPYFDQVVEEAVAPSGRQGGREIIDALVEAGFDKAQMEVTPDRTSVDLEADTIEFSVRIGRECLVGQSGKGNTRTRLLPMLGTGKCLVGKTRAIDW